MNNIHPPLYRAKESYTGKYIEGYLTPYCPTQRNDYDDWYIITSSGRIVQIDPTTLAIHHQGMLDSEDNKIFASLSDDGLGGDIFQGASEELYKKSATEYFYIFTDSKLKMYMEFNGKLEYIETKKLYKKVTGIKGEQ